MTAISMKGRIYWTARDKNWSGINVSFFSEHITLNYNQQVHSDAPKAARGPRVEPVEKGRSENLQ